MEPFNKAKKFGSYVKVCRAAVWHLTRSKQRVLVEPFLSNFQNFNSNTGWQGSTNWSEALQSLSHFSYHHSQGDLVLCDLQGSVQDGEVVWTSALDLPSLRELGIFVSVFRSGSSWPRKVFAPDRDLRIWGPKASRTSSTTTCVASGATLLGPNLERPRHTSDRRQVPR